MKIALTALFVALSLFVFGQNDQGVIIYSQTIRMDFSNRPNIPEAMREMLKTLPKEQSFKKQLLFSPTATLYTAWEDPNAVIEPPAEDGRGMLRMMMMRPDEATYTDIANGTVIEKKDLFGRSFLIRDTLESLQWKITGQTKMIGEYLCMEATSKIDTLPVQAWFCPSIPVPSGPEGIGQLPGLVLECSLKNGFVSMTLDSILFREVKAEEMSPPDKGKEVTREEYRAIVKAKRDEMKEMGGRSGEFRMGN